MLGAIVVLVIVGLAVRSSSPSRSVGHGAVEEACFNFSRAVHTPNKAAAHQRLERAQDAAARSQDLALAADFSRVSKMYEGKGTGAALNNQLVQNALTECHAQGWEATDPCRYGTAVCGPIVAATTTTS